MKTIFYGKKIYSPEVLKENNKQTIEKQNEIEKLVNNINQLQ